MKKPCPHCGSSIERDATYCPFCNSVIEAGEGVPAFIRDGQAKQPASASGETAGTSAADHKPFISKGMDAILNGRKKSREQKKDGAEENCFVFVGADALDGLMVCGFTGAYPAELVIPAQHNGKPVVAIGREAFKGKQVCSVLIPPSVQAIGEAAFMNCTALFEVRDGSGLQTIGEDAFKGCCMLDRFPALNCGGIQARCSSFAGCYQLGLAAESACGIS